MPKSGIYKPKEIINSLKKLGFEIIRTRGSHIQLKKGKNLVTVPFHNKDLSRITFKSILRQSGISESELIKNL